MGDSRYFTPAIHTHTTLSLRSNMGVSSSKIELKNKLFIGETRLLIHQKKLREVELELQNERMSNRALQVSKNNILAVKRDLENSLRNHQNAYNKLDSSGSLEISELSAKNAYLENSLTNHRNTIQKNINAY